MENKNNEWLKMITKDMIEEFLKLTRHNFKELNFSLKENQIITDFLSYETGLNPDYNFVIIKNFYCSPIDAYMTRDIYEYSHQSYKPIWLHFLTEKFQGVKIENETFGEMVLRNFDEKTASEKESKLKHLKGLEKFSPNGISDYYKDVRNQRKNLEKIVGMAENTKPVETTK